MQTVGDCSCPTIPRRVEVIEQSNVVLISLGVYMLPSLVANA